MALAVLARPGVRAACRPLMVGHRALLQELAASLPACEALRLEPAVDAGAAFAMAAEAGAPVPVLELETPPPGSGDAVGRPCAAFGAAAVEGVRRGAELCLGGHADALVTPPIHKRSMHLAGFDYEGQTALLGEVCGTARHGMLACNGELRVLLATRHLPLRAALDALTVERVAEALVLAHEAGRELFGVEHPRVALAALNPHAGEGGAFGDEEARVLEPAIARVREEHGWDTAGPAVPDVVFAEGARGDWDVVVALYHDQGFLPLKMLPRESGYTVFVGAGLLRVSPMHGAAYDVARAGRADPEPFAHALRQALRMAGAGNRRNPGLPLDRT